MPYPYQLNNIKTIIYNNYEYIKRGKIMQRLVVDVEDRYTNLVIDLLSNLKQNVVKNVAIQKKQTKDKSKLDTFRRLRDKSNNKTTLTMAMATNTNEMANNGIF